MDSTSMPWVGAKMDGPAGSERSEGKTSGLHMRLLNKKVILEAS